MKIKIGVMGSASGPVSKDPNSLKTSEEIGRLIAQRNCIMITGACPGLPYAAAFGAQEAGGFVLGVSPAFSNHEHTIEYKSPDDMFDFILYSAMGFMERDIVNIRASDGIIFLGGGMGTLNEFTIAFEEGKPIGVLTGLGGITDHFPKIIEWCRREIHPNMIFSDNPEELVDGLLERIEKYPSPIHEDARVTDIKFGKHRG